MTAKPIVFFDGICHLCNGFVDSVIIRDKEKKLNFAPLQGETALTRLSANEISDLNSVILWIDGKTYSKSTAILHILSIAIWPYKFWLAGLLIPAFLRNWIYDWVAKNRYLWFGRREICRLPTPEERDRLLP
jgi:predicted DCC family thiol-disulfide oxidoreductase YuxK